MSPEQAAAVARIREGAEQAAMCQPALPAILVSTADAVALLAALDAAQAPLTLDTAPIGTKAPAFNGGHWTRVAAGWKWCTGSTFPRPGGDWTGELIAPDAAAHAPREVPRLTDADLSAAMEAADFTYEPTKFARVVESRVRALCGVAP